MGSGGELEQAAQMGDGALSWIGEVDCHSGEPGVSIGDIGRGGESEPRVTGWYVGAHLGDGGL